LRRLQTFVNCLFSQTKRYEVSAELVLVEWNPPPDRPSLAQSLQWPQDSGPCQVRIITVPPRIHRLYRHADALPLYQMIGKNAGIRRAAGEFILATNIDILFSSELMEFFARQRLEHGRMYRLDRYDVEADVPPDASPEAQLAYCRNHLIRVNAREGTFRLTADGRRAPAPVDITSPETGVSFGSGWGPPEQYFGQLFRAAQEETELMIAPAAMERTLLLELEPVFTGGEALSLTLVSVVEKTLQIRSRSLVRIPVPAGQGRIHLQAHFSRPPAQTTTSRFRAFVCAWSKVPTPQSFFRAERAPSHVLGRIWRLVTSGARFAKDLSLGKGSGSIGLPLSWNLAGRLRSNDSGISVGLRRDAGRSRALPIALPAALHTNACGDFTLTHRRHWMELRGYPEFDLYSMNLDSVFCYMAHYGGAKEHVLSEPMRIYHIEHASGSGWTPSGQGLLYRRLGDQGIPWLPFETVLQWAAQMETLQTTMIFNDQDWGLAQFELPEIRPLI
jgi:hypothetical protein